MMEMVSSVRVNELVAMGVTPPLSEIMLMVGTLTFGAISFSKRHTVASRGKVMTSCGPGPLMWPHSENEGV